MLGAANLLALQTHPRLSMRIDSKKLLEAISGIVDNERVNPTPLDDMDPGWRGGDVVTGPIPDDVRAAREHALSLGETDDAMLLLNKLQATDDFGKQDHAFGNPNRNSKITNRLESLVVSDTKYLPSAHKTKSNPKKSTCKDIGGSAGARRGMSACLMHPPISYLSLMYRSFSVVHDHVIDGVGGSIIYTKYAPKKKVNRKKNKTGQVTTRQKDTDDESQDDEGENYDDVEDFSEDGQDSGDGDCSADNVLPSPPPSSNTRSSKKRQFVDDSHSSSTAAAKKPRRATKSAGS